MLCYLIVFMLCYIMTLSKTVLISVCFNDNLIIPKFFLDKKLRLCKTKGIKWLFMLMLS